MANGDGTDSTRLASLPGAAAWSNTIYDAISTRPVWSPDGRKIVLTRFDANSLIPRLWEISSDGSGLHRMFPGWHEKTGECCGSWTPDGKYFIFASQGQIWARRQRSSFLYRTSPEPVELTAGAVSYHFPLAAKDGKTIFAVASFRRGELQRYDPQSKAFESYLGGISAEDVAFSKDGQWVAYVSFPDGTLWRSKLDGTEKIQLSTPGMYAMAPRWSPDGKQIVFSDQPPHSLSSRIYVVASGGGSPAQLMPNLSGEQSDPTWSPDGQSLAFGGLGSLPGLAIHILNTKTRQETTVPGSQGLFSPRWSPDGRYLAALKWNSAGMSLFDFKTGKWSVLTDGIVSYPAWSHDGRFVYFVNRTGANRGAVERLAVPRGNVEPVAAMSGIPQTGVYGHWFGLTPDDAPLLLKDAGSDEMVSMAWREP